MTKFITQATVGPVIGSMVGKDKGDISNRGKCAGKQFLNNVGALAADTVVIGGVNATLKGMKKGKFQKLQNTLAKFIDKIANKMPKKFVFNKNAFKTGEKVIENVDYKLVKKLKALPPLAKAAVALIMPALALVSYITGRRIYKMGQIDQKYTDKAALEKHNKEVL